MVKKHKSSIFSNQSVQKIPPKYEDLNVFMRPSLLSPKYEYPNLRVSPDSRESSRQTNSDGSESESESAGECNVSYKTDGSYAANTSSKDLKLYDMKCLLDKKRKDIYDKNREVTKLASENPYLSSIVSDYENIGSAVLEEKKDQKTALKILSKHIRAISEHIKHDEFQLRRIREDQQVLMSEIDKLRKDIGYIHNKLAGDSANNKERKDDKENKENKYPNWHYDDDQYDDQYDDEAEDNDSFSSDYHSDEA